MIFCRNDTKQFKQIRPIFIYLLSTVLIFIIAGCNATNHRVISNPNIEKWDGKRMRYKNLFPSKYSYMEETQYDRIQFMKPHELKPRKYRLVHNPKGDIDRKYGYDPAEFTATPDLAAIAEPTHGVQITFIRHATFLIQLGGKYQILVDPVLEIIDGMAGKLMKYADTFELLAEPPIITEDIPFESNPTNNSENKVNIVAISHDHFDHLNFNTVNKLPENTHYYVPLELEKQFPSALSNVTGMDWYTSDTIGDLKITFLPVNHRSGRSMNEMNQTLWGGWLFEWNGHRIFFAGDSGYSDVFKDIAAKYGKFDVCLMPIAAWAWRQWHFTPEDAIVAAMDLGAKTFIPWAWGTWIMSYEHILEPLRRLEYAWNDMHPPNMELRILKMGETFYLN